MEEKQLSEKESLLIIQQMISRAKNEFVDTGVGPILWGAVITVCSLVQFLQIHFDYRLPVDIWLLALLAIVPQIYISIKESRQRKVKGWDQDVMSYVWLCFGVGIFLVNFINNVAAHELNPLLSEYSKLSGKTDVPNFWTFGASYLLFVYGYPTIVTGATRKFKLMIFGGVFCWVSAIISAFTEVKIDFLLMALSATLAWLVPGIILRRNYLLQKEKNV